MQLTIMQHFHMGQCVDRLGQDNDEFAEGIPSIVVL